MIRLFNTLTRKTEEFKPIIPNKVKFYSCGPTVYHYTHIGNLRSFVLADLLKRMFLANGYEVFNVMNITDVGHLISDEDYGEDKMEQGAQRENKNVWEIAEFYKKEFLNDLSDLNILMPTKMPKATDYINEQIDLIKKLENKGYTYLIENDGIYYDTSKFENYGCLCGEKLASSSSTHSRIGYNNLKKNSADFALWKFSPKDKKRAMEWDSPWGKGFPGWHLECSAMSNAILGERFDLHTGGIDLSRIHHTNEIAQSQPLTKEKWVNYWIHSEFLVNKSGNKMSKSSGEFLTMSYLKKKNYDPLAYKFMLLLGHYQSQLIFSFESLDSASNTYFNIIKKIKLLIEENSGNIDFDIYKMYKEKLISLISNNLKTLDVIVSLQELLKDNNINSKTKIEIFKFADELLGLKFLEKANELIIKENSEIPDIVKEIFDKRNYAKKNKNYELADNLRKEIENYGFLIKDTKEESILIKK